jgi:uncharacterized protein involved in exopolysaccharide biosynthesis
MPADSVVEVNDSQRPFGPAGGMVLFLERRWRTLLIAALVGFAAGAIAGRLMPSWYAANARMALLPVDDPTNSGGLNALDGANATLPAIAAVLRSRNVADQTVAALGLAGVYGTNDLDRAREGLVAHLSISTDRKANVVTLEAEDRSPARAQAICAKVAELAIARCVDLWAARNRAHRLRLEADLTEVSARLRSAEDAMRRFRERTQVVDLQAQVKATVDQSAALERLRIDKDLSLSFLRDFGDAQSIEVKRALRERSATAHALHALRARHEKTVGPLLPLDALPALEVEYGRLKRELETLSARHDLLALKVTELQTAEARPDGRAEIIDSPAVPKRRSRPSRKLLCTEGAFGAAFVTAVVLVISGKRRRLI